MSEEVDYRHKLYVGIVSLCEQYSECVSTLEIVGAIETAKAQVIENWLKRQRRDG